MRILPNLLNKLQPAIARQKELLLNDYRKKIDRFLADRLGQYTKNLDELERCIKNYNPERQLQLGYSILRKDDSIIRSIVNVKTGDGLSIQVSDGIINTIVK